MTRHRITLAVLMLAIAIIAINVAALRYLASFHPRLALGIAPGALCLQFMSWVLIRQRGRMRAFAVGFLTAGGIFAWRYFQMFARALTLPHYDPEATPVLESPELWTQLWNLCDTCIQWPYRFLTEHLPWIAELIAADNALGMIIGATVVFSIQFLFALAGGVMALCVFWAVRGLVHARIASPSSGAPQK
jgi:hypothetical protein